MKPFFFTAILCTFFFAAAQAQTNPVNTWVSDKGFWVVESNKHTPKEAIVYFYNNDKLLVYKEVISGRRLKLHKKKTLYCLKAALEEAIDNSQKGVWASQEQKLVLQHLQK